MRNQTTETEKLQQGNWHKKLQMKKKTLQKHNGNDGEETITRIIR